MSAGSQKKRANARHQRPAPPSATKSREPRPSSSERRHERSPKSTRPLAGKHKTERARPLRAVRALVKRPWLLATTIALGVAVVTLVTLVGGYGRLGGTQATESPVVIVDWPPDLDSERAGALLEELGLVKSGAMMTLYLRATGGASSIIPGPHLLVRGQSPAELAACLRRSFLRPKARVTLPEGLHMFEVGARLERERITSRAAFLEAARDPDLLRELGLSAREGSARSVSVRAVDTAQGASARAVDTAQSASIRAVDTVRTVEGYLFPATYELPLDSDPREVVRRLVQEFDKRWAALQQKHAAGLASLEASLGFGRHEVVTLASLVEKEAAVADERSTIAGVFLNRLLDPTFQPKRLQSDPTAAYGCLVDPAIPACSTFRGKVTPELLRDPANGYSTYVTHGLPPGPIANPGEASLRAVLEPKSSKYLYFVAKGGGRHTFSESLDAHNAAVKALRDARRSE
jgi:UPF0755 protein